ncbi:MAG: hypothetical protein WA728_29240 [Xanthobacteraceae bacterium]
MRRLTPTNEGTRAFYRDGWFLGVCQQYAPSYVVRSRFDPGFDLIGSGVKSPHSMMLWHKWVVLITGSTGSALRAVRPPNLHITPITDAISLRCKRHRSSIALTTVPLSKDSELIGSFFVSRNEGRSMKRSGLLSDFNRLEFLYPQWENALSRRRRRRKSQRPKT